MEPEVHYRIHNCPPPVPILSQLHPVQTSTSHFLKIHFNTSIILPSTPGSPKWSPSHRFHHHNLVYTSPIPHTRYMPRPSHSRFYHRNSMGEESRSLGSSLCIFLHYPVNSSLLGPIILLSTLFSNNVT